MRRFCDAMGNVVRVRARQPVLSIAETRHAVAPSQRPGPPPASTASAVPPLPGLFSIGLRQWMVLLTVQMSTLLFGMTITLANVVLPQIRGSLSATQDEISWVITLNLVATAVATPMTGWLASRLGWRNVMFYSVLGFTVSSFLCGIADSLETLVLYRVGQGLFGATIMPMGQGIVLATFPRHLHTAVMVIWGAGSVMGPVFGPIFGSIMAESLQLARRLLHDRAARHHGDGPASGSRSRSTRTRSRAQLDWTGFLALSVAITGLQLMIDRGQRLDWFESPEICLRGLRRCDRVLDFPGAQPDREPPVPQPAAAARPQFRDRPRHRVLHGHAGLHQPRAVAGHAARSARLPRQRDRAAAGRARHRQLDGVPGRRAVLAALPAAVGRHRAVRAGLCRLVDGAVRHQCRQLRRVLDECAAGVRVRARLHADDGARLRHPAGAARSPRPRASSRWCAISGRACTSR